MKLKGIVLAAAATMFVSLTSFTLVNRIRPEAQQEKSFTNCDEDQCIESNKKICPYFCDTRCITVDIWYCPSSRSYYANMTSPEKKDHMTIFKMKDTGAGNAYISYDGCSTYFFYLNTSTW